jgi:enamine deaminase RidA (YjgF/YER057c/UK114 family)
MAEESAEHALERLNIELPQPPRPVASYVPIHRAGNLLFTSGVVPTWNGEVQMRGVVGADLTVEEGARAAEICVLNIVSLLREQLGSLERIAQFIQLTGFVRSASGFQDQPKVMNGASDLLVRVFGERGRHTRQAIGTSELPLGVPVEVSAIVRVEA